MKFEKDVVYKVHVPKWVVPGASHSVRLQGDTGQLVLVPLEGEVPGSPAGIVIEKRLDSKSDPTAEDFANGESHECRGCRKTKSCVYTIDPYKEDVGNTEEWGWWCYPCYEARRDDI